jgi:hypothetical protein
MRWKTARVVDASDESVLFRQLERHCRDTGQPFVFHIAEYPDETRKWGFPPSLPESWGCTHLGSPASSVLIGLDKEGTKEVLRRAAVPTPRSFVTEPGYPDAHDKAAAIGFPLFVKPLREGGHLACTTILLSATCAHWTAPPCGSCSVFAKPRSSRSSSALAE